MRKLRSINVSTRLGDYLPISSKHSIKPPHPQYPATDVETSQMAYKQTFFHISNTNLEGMELK